MRLIYFDEVKYQPPKQPRHWIGALSISADDLPRLEERISVIAETLFGTKELGPGPLRRLIAL